MQIIYYIVKMANKHRFKIKKLQDNYISCGEHGIIMLMKTCRKISDAKSHLSKITHLKLLAVNELVHEISLVTDQNAAGRTHCATVLSTTLIAIYSA